MIAQTGDNIERKSEKNMSMTATDEAGLIGSLATVATVGALSLSLSAM